MDEPVKLEELPRSVCAIVDVRGRVLGTGFFVNTNGAVLTCAHVVRGHTDHIRVKLYKVAEPVTATIFALNEEIDAAILMLAGTRQPPLGAQLEWRVGMEVTSYGFPEDRPISQFPSGVPFGFQILNRTQVDDGTGPDDALELIGPAERGLSGAPALDVATGKVIGLVRWKHGANTCFATPLSVLFHNLPDLAALWTVDRPLLDWGNLPYALNREMQGPEIISHMADTLRGSSCRPQFFAIRGPDDECPDMLLELLTDAFLPRIAAGENVTDWRPGVSSAPATAPTYEWTNVLWPRNKSDKSIDMLNAQVQRALDALVGRDPLAPDAEEPLAEALAQTDMPLLVRATIDSQVWAAGDSRLLEDWAAYWRKLPDLAQGRIVAVFVVVYYRETSEGLWQRLTGAGARKIEKFLANLTGVTRPLPMLGPVPQLDAENWARALNARGHWTVALQKVLDDVALSYQKIGGSPAEMKSVGVELERILSKHSRT